ncbi:hypothetical protein P8C59_008723 [Phyllachora maydis]|uniref:DUF676 domain-containing protein n=1 Tax=Phyllachora maydis TaxID=1825666 RepID=A0AAD9MFH2_9PEZI|nr:hypothetical protein P8C59_008723 [Phyllachora maydis]
MGSIAHDDAEAGFAHMDGDVNGPTGYNETTVDIPLPEGHFGFPAPAASESREQPTLKQLAGDAILSPAINRHLPRAAHVWVRQGLRKELVREGLPPSRPLFFIAHSIGGLVVKLALLWARKIQDYRAILLNCHGVSFFATPHRGSSYLTMRHLKESIQTLLRLHRPLPRSLMEELRLGNKTLLSMHDQFVDLTGELRLWTFYETVDSQLSGLGLGLTSEVQFSAPIVSIKSAIMGLRHETVYGVDSDHAHCASFGPDNIRTMTSYLEDLTSAIGKAQKLSVRYMHIPLRLEEQVDVEVTGFYEDPDRDMEPAIRLYITKHHLNDFLLKASSCTVESNFLEAFE